MKRLFLAFLLLSPGLALTQTPPPAPATVADVLAGTATYKFISPAAAAGAGLSSPTNGSFQRIFNIVNYGANGSDGIIGQDQYAIQAAIDAANAAGGGIVYMPPGTYYVGPWTYHTNYTSENHPNCIDLTETANITLRGAGKDKSKVAIYPTVAIPAIHNIFGAGDTVSVISNRFGATNLIFEDFTIDGGMNWGVATNQQFSFDSTQFYRNTGYPITFRRMGWINIWEDAIDAQGMVIAENCTATNVGNQFLGSGEPHIARGCIGWNIGCGLAPLNYYVALETLNPSQSYLTDCKFYGGGGRYHWTGAGVVRNCEFTWTNTPVYEFGFIEIDGPSANVNFENCIFNRTTGTPFIFTVLGNSVLTLSGNRFGQYCMAICSTNSRVNVTDNFISSDNGPTILFDGSVSGRVSHNQITGAAAANPTIVIQGASTRRSDGLTIVNNDITGHLQFSDTARGTNIVIAHNTISDGSIRNYSGSVTNSFYDSNSYRSVSGGGGQMVFSMSPQIVRNNFGFQLYFTSDAGHWPDGDYFENNVFSGPVSGISTGYIDNGNTNCIWINNRFMTNYATPFEPTYVTITANSALTKYHQRVIFNGSSITCTLPSAVSVGRGWRVNVKNIHSTALTVATVSSQTVDGAAPTTMAQWISRTFVSDGSNWLTECPPTTGIAGGTNQFWIAASPPNEKYTNLFGDTMEISGAYRVLTVGTNVGNNVQISDGISSFPNGMWIDAGAQEYFVGKISVGTSRGQFQLGSGAVSNLTATGTIYAPSNNISGGISAGSITVGTSPAKIFIDGSTGSGGFSDTVYPTNVTASRMAFIGPSKAITNAGASGAIPINADGSASTSAQIGGLFTGGSTYLKADGTTGTGGAGSSDGNTPFGFELYGNIQNAEGSGACYSPSLRLSAGGADYVEAQWPAGTYTNIMVTTMPDSSIGAGTNIWMVGVTNGVKCFAFSLNPSGGSKVSQNTTASFTVAGNFRFSWIITNNSAGRIDAYKIGGTIQKQ